MKEKITSLIIAVFIATSIKYLKFQNLIFCIDALCRKTRLLLSFLDSHKTNFTEIDLIPIESKQLNTPFYQSARKNY